MNLETFKYDNRIVRAFAIATIIFGLVGFSAGLLIACQLFWPELNLNLQFTGLVQPTPAVEVVAYDCTARRKDGAPYHALISSGYVKREGGWKLAFHQQTEIS